MGFSRMLDEADAAVVAGQADGDAEFVRKRISRLREFQGKAADVLNNPLVNFLMK
jgi:hypothetical protein